MTRDEFARYLWQLPRAARREALYLFLERVGIAVESGVGVSDAEMLSADAVKERIGG